MYWTLIKNLSHHTKKEFIMFKISVPVSAVADQVNSIKDQAVWVKFILKVKFQTIKVVKVAITQTLKTRNT